VSAVVRAWMSVVFVAVVLVAAVATSRRSDHDFPSSDIAVEETYTILAGQGRLLVGPYSRYSWHHPGPIYFYLLWPFYALSGERTAGLYAGAAVMNCAWVAVALTIAYRSGWGTFSLLFPIAETVFLWRFPDVIVSPWNPHVVLLPMVALVLSSATVFAGEVLWLPVSAVAFSIAAQTHVALAVPAALLFAGSFGRCIIFWRTREQPLRHHAWRAMWLTAALTLAAWSPTIVEQIAGTPGNLTLLSQYFGGAASPGASAGRALRAVSGALWGMFDPSFGVAQGWPVVPSDHLPEKSATIALLVGTMVLAVAGWFRPPRFGTYVSFSVAAVLLSAWGSVARVNDQLFDHHIFWLSGIGVVAAATAGSWALSRIYRGGNDRVFPQLALASGLICVGSCLLLGEMRLWGRSSDPRLSADATRVRDLSSAVIAFARAEGARPLVMVPQDSWNTTAGIVLQLQRARIPFAVEPTWLDMFTKELGPRGTETVAVSIVKADQATRHRILGRSGDLAVAVLDSPLRVHTEGR
jgi:multisubunit Na+/H+ antiporter MnhB subunit